MIDQKQTNKLCLRWKGKQRRIGITGGIASGKTIIGDFLFQAKQWPIVDADLYAHEALRAESLISKKVLLRYGSKIIQNSSKNDQIINRKALAKIVFQNDVEKEWLEAIIHPFVNNRIEDELEKIKSNCIDPKTKKIPAIPSAKPKSPTLLTIKALIAALFADSL